MRGHYETTDGDSYSSRLTSFCRFLRENGICVSTADMLTAARALTSVDTANRTRVREILRPVLVGSPTDNAAFGPLFDEFWSRDRGNADGTLAEDMNETESRSDADDSATDRIEERDDATGEPMPSPADRTERGGGSSERGKQSVDGRTRRQSDEQGEFHYETISFVQGEGATRHAPRPPDRGHDGDDISRHVTEVGRKIGALPGYQRRSSPFGRIDLRQSLRVTHQLGLVEPPRQHRERSLTRVSLFVDVSQSMLENLDQQFLLRFLSECVTQFAAVRIFFFDTEVIEVTRHFRATNLQETLDDLERAQTEWGAGTNIGACLRDALASSPFAVDNQTVGVILSDGWDAGDDDVLRKAISTLRYRSDRLIWLHPLASQPGFEPTVRGLQTTLPYVDQFLPFGDRADLEAVAGELDES